MKIFAEMVKIEGYDIHEYDTLAEALTDPEAPEWCLFTAESIIGGRFVIGERAIARNAKTAYEYAILLGKKFILGERTIAKSPRYSYLYAKEFGRFLAGEKILAKSPQYAFKYGKLIRERFGEKAIATSAKYSFEQSRLYEERFILGEAAIATELWPTYNYIFEVVKGPFPIGESILATNAHCACDYAVKFLKGRFLLGEKIIATDPFYYGCYKRGMEKLNAKT